MQFKSKCAVATATLAATLYFSPAGIAASCIGNCGSNPGVVDGSIVPAPGNFGKYDWVSTNLGQQGAARIDGYSGSATNGSELISDAFFGAAGQKISFDFNYVTSDGAGFADYGFAQLVNTASGQAINLFTARTHPTEPVVPGFNMPPLGATVSPATVLITPGAPVWSPLGGSSGACYSGGCGYTGWVHSEFMLQESGTYQLRFGAANWADTAYDSGLAFSGLLLDGSTIGDGSSFDSPLLPTDIDPVTGAFEFEFVATPATPVVIDPLVATGYEFASNIGILSAEFEFLGDSEYLISFLDSSNVLINTLFAPSAGSIFDFTPYDADGVLNFTVSGIDTSLMLDPADTTAFKTKLLFNVAGPTTINITQTPLTTFVNAPVPEPSTWAMLVMGFGTVGYAMRRRRKANMAISFA